MRSLQVKFTRAYDGTPLAEVHGLPGDGGELRPRQVRALAGTLVRIAGDLDAGKMTHRGRPLPDECRGYPVE
jgi:hypothetical protein